VSDDQTTFHFSRELRAAIERAAKRERRTPSAVIRNALEDRFLARRDPARRKLKPATGEHLAVWRTL
jgi:predicted transcriptional regulator